MFFHSYISAIPSGDKLVDRGNASDYDFRTGNLTKDGNWHELDLSGIVGAGARFVTLKVVAQTTTYRQSFYAKVIGYANDYNGFVIFTNVVDVDISGEFTLPLSIDKKIEYKTTPATWTALSLIVLRWII